jgi:hypothetical protein
MKLHYIVIVLILLGAYFGYICTHNQDYAYSKAEDAPTIAPADKVYYVKEAGPGAGTKGLPDNVEPDDQQPGYDEDNEDLAPP